MDTSQNAFPHAFAGQMQRLLGDEYAAFEAAHGQPGPVSIRLNKRKYSDASLQLDSERIPWCESGRYLAQRPVFTLDPAFHGGAYYVQEPSSMFLEQAFLQHVPANGALRILDLCAAPGGKTTHLLNLMNKDSLLVTNEVIRSRASTLLENVQKSGYPNAVVTSNDASDFQNLPGFFDVIVVDAPCSGEGLFRKDETTMKEWSERNVELCAARQQRILEDVWPSLRQGGILIYSTCTYNKLENEENLRWLDAHNNVDYLSISIKDDWGIVEISDAPVHGYRFMPHRVKGEGFFMAVIRKNDPHDEIAIRKKQKTFTPAPRNVVAEVIEWLNPDDFQFIQRNDTIQMLPAAWVDTIHYLSQTLRVLYSGTFLARQKHTKLVPEHTLALSVYLNRSQFDSIDLTLEDAIAYLKKDTVNINHSRKGFALAAWNEVALGWMNVVPGRINNLYPPEWRIRMQ
ncbi:MAG TPA: hypothetical protein VKZ68_10935 [Ohtaekwangia sp.]|nr:hypothetical protein [Ohtaekwangia sp.]